MHKEEKEENQEGMKEKNLISIVTCLLAAFVGR